MKRALYCLLLLTPLAWGHEIGMEIRQQEAVVIRLNYIGGQPFAFEAYELYRPDEKTPEQVGRTNARGEIIVLPGKQATWYLKAYSADGHGIAQTIHLTSLNYDSEYSPTEANVHRFLLIALGFGILLFLFVIVQRLARKKKP